MSEFIYDLSRCVRYIDDENHTVIRKTWSVTGRRFELRFISGSRFDTDLRDIIIREDVENKRPISAYQFIRRHISYLTIRGIAFNAPPQDRVMNMFRGFKYARTQSNDDDDKAVDSFFDFVREVVCGDNDDHRNDIYNYILNWLAFIVQHPGTKTETALVLKGFQGSGKNTFTDVICEVLNGYSVANVTDINELTGQFNAVVEHKMLLVLNEMKNAGDDRLANFNALKSIITDREIRVNEKHQPRRTAENVANLIFCTNNEFPVKIEMSDRRYLVINVSSKRIGDYSYWSSLRSSWTKGFYGALTRRLLERDISNFNTRNIPMTDAKLSIMNASMSIVDRWIAEHFEEISGNGNDGKGMLCERAREWRPEGISQRNFELALNDRCTHYKSRTSSGARPYFYKLKPEVVHLYDPKRFESVTEFKQCACDRDPNPRFFGTEPAELSPEEL